MRVHPEMRDRLFASFMLRQLEVEARKQGYVGLIGDVREEKRDVLASFCKLGFSPVLTIPLYESDKRDVIVIKLFDKQEQQDIFSLLGNKFHPN